METHFPVRTPSEMPGAPPQRFMFALVMATEKSAIFCTQAAGPGLLPQPLSGPQRSSQALLAALWGSQVFSGSHFSIFSSQSASNIFSVKVTDGCHSGWKLCCSPASPSCTCHHLPSHPRLKMPFRTPFCLHCFHFLPASASASTLITHRLSTSSLHSLRILALQFLPSIVTSFTHSAPSGRLSHSQIRFKKEEQSRALGLLISSSPVFSHPVSHIRLSETVLQHSAAVFMFVLSLDFLPPSSHDVCHSNKTFTLTTQCVLRLQQKTTPHPLAILAEQ